MSPAPADKAVARVEQVPPGTHQVVTVNGREIGIFNVRGNFYAIANTCLHQGGPVCRGRLGAALVASADTGWQPRWGQEGEVITCPWHQLEFNVTDGSCLAYPDRKLATFRLTVTRGEIYLTT